MFILLQIYGYDWFATNIRIMQNLKHKKNKEMSLLNLEFSCGPLKMHFLVC